jgi:CheY-like chemotaxis protein
MPHKLLLADDSITIQRVIELTFADEDVQVVAVGDGKKAIASIQSDRPDIVLADVGMPERDGYEVAEFIKGNPQLAAIPVLLLTGAFEPIDETRARAVGCDGVLVKPFEPQMVINRVKDLLAGRRAGGLWGNKAAPSPPSREAAPAPPAKETDAQPASAESGASTSASLEDYFDRLDAAFASVEAATAHGVTTGAPRSGAAPSSDSVSAASSGLEKHDLEGWDPDLTGDPVRPADVPPTPAPAPVVVAPAPNPPIRFKPVAVAPPVVAPPATVATPAAPAPAVETPLSASTTVAAVESPVEHKPPMQSPPAVAPAVPVPPAAPPASPPPVSSGVATLPSLAEAFAMLLSAEQGRSISPSRVGVSNVPDETIDEIVSRVVARMTDQAVRETEVNVAERLVREEIQRIKLGQ